MQDMRFKLMALLEEEFFSRTTALSRRGGLGALMNRRAMPGRATHAGQVKG
jgi:hypothetical protein